jgi:hypothetical protein
MSEQQPNSELLKLEYEQCNEGYNNRDTLTQDGFVKIVQNFNIFIVIVLLSFSSISTIKLEPPFHAGFLILVGLAGFIALFSQTVELASNITCKIALRSRASEVEEKLASTMESNDVQLWHRIFNRHRNIVEKVLKRSEKSEREEAETNWFLAASWLFMVIWVLTIICSVIWVLSGHIP